MLRPDQPQIRGLCGAAYPLEEGAREIWQTIDEELTLDERAMATEDLRDEIGDDAYAAYVARVFVRHEQPITTREDTAPHTTLRGGMRSDSVAPLPMAKPPRPWIVTRHNPIEKL